jgi:hypothetical protein
MDQLLMPEFNLEHETVFHRYVESKQKAAKSQERRFGSQEEGELEIRRFEAWCHETLLLPDPVAVALELVIVENSAAINLLKNDVYYSSFLCDDMSHAPASLVSSLGYFSFPVSTIKNN